jgi:hypothetical protein
MLMRCGRPVVIVVVWGAVVDEGGVVFVILDFYIKGNGRARSNVVINT